MQGREVHTRYKRRNQKKDAATWDTMTGKAERREQGGGALVEGTGARGGGGGGGAGVKAGGQRVQT